MPRAFHMYALDLVALERKGRVSLSLLLTLLGLEQTDLSVSVISLHQTSSPVIWNFPFLWKLSVQI